MSGSIVSSPEHQAGNAKQWNLRTRLSLGSLTLSVFALVFSEFLPAGLITPLASDLAISEGAAGQAVTATAIGGMFSALLTGLLIGNSERRMVLYVLCGMALVSNAACAVATSLPVLVVARAAIGISIGGFWALSTAVVGRLVSAADIGRAMGGIMAGVSLATISAPPVATFVATHLGWRMAFALAALISLLALLAQIAALPRLPSSQPVSLRALLEVGRRRFVYVGLVAVVGIAAGHFAGFTFLRLVLQDLGDLRTGPIAMALLAFGLCNFGGTLIGARFVDRHLATMLSGSAAIIGACALCISAGPSTVWIIALVCLWGVAFGAAPIALQTWMARGASDQLESVGSLFISTFQIAIALGAAAGGLIVDGYGIRAVMIFTGLLTLLGVLAPAFTRSTQASLH
ncbi:MAG: MFS transporter [Pseudomonadota bacterium]|nr:MFS transporter [Pseudomonadota bacterium]